MNQKLIRFALGRGFTFDIIRQCMDVEEEMEDWEEE
jgi:regulatory protein